MIRIILFIVILIIAIVLIACNNSPLTLEKMKNNLEKMGEFEIYPYYMPADHDYPLDEITTGGFSFNARTDTNFNTSIAANTSVIVMEFKNKTDADGYVQYLILNKNYWMTIQNGKFLIAVSNRNFGVASYEMTFLNKLITGE